MRKVDEGGKGYWMKNNKALFVTHKEWLDSTVTGGVQLCSREFLNLLKESGFDIDTYHVPITRRLSDRVALKFNLSVYNLFDIEAVKGDLLDRIANDDISSVFFNMAGLLRLAKPLKETFGASVRLYLASHGNDSGDFLHLTTKPLGNPGFIRRHLNIIRLGYLIHTESYYRNYYLDGVLTVSDVEKELENWFGARKNIYIPRLLEPVPLLLTPVPGRIGFVGRLDHPPNIQGISILLDEVIKDLPANTTVRVVGAPREWGIKIAQRYPCVEYVGELSDDELVAEVQSWMLFLNPVFWFSTGVTTKVGWALNLGLPIISTPAGLRGYSWKDGTLLMADTPQEMAAAICRYLRDPSGFADLRRQVERIQASAISKEEVFSRVRSLLHEAPSPNSPPNREE
jgi:Glycosyl transferases group 1